ncbi:outer membrane protein assembly factor BamB family protein [Thalassoroseus pseudoceratinae]|uniref:outer membrane protein assembly factor BamB family protein n=1 Tax=Thalassoroseus pseudoceratinae TaxID=2713176 RepID=UPI0014209908|nr:PQQ-binding-like beta-propeller repeat protein [Thalassoroseus pseudoceratinae]
MATTSCCPSVPRSLLACLVLIVGWVPSVGHAQVQAPNRPIFVPPNVRLRQFQPSPRGVHNAEPSFTVDRESTQLLNRARGYLEKSKYDLALPRLQALLNQDSDTFYQPDAETDANRYVSVKAASLAMIDNLAEDGRRLYELQYGPVAKRLLERGMQTGDQVALEDAVRKYNSTEAGFEAGYRLGQWRLDQGEPAAAALQFQSLLRHPDRAKRFEPTLSVMLSAAWAQAGHPEESQAAWDRAAKFARQDRIELGGREYTVAELSKNYIDLFSPQSNRSQLTSRSNDRDWLLFRGNASRTATSPAVLPSSDIAWNRPTLVTESFFGPTTRHRNEIEQLVDHLRMYYRQIGRLSGIPTMHPLVVGDLVIVRALSNVQAYRQSTGELAWETARLDRSLLELLDDPSSRRRINGDARSDLENYLTQRLWLDSTFGQISSDGVRVFAIEEMGFRGRRQLTQRGEPHPSAPTDTNRLVAYDISTDGQIAWQTGGPLAGYFFLGPPLPLGPELYCLAESGGEVSLIVLRADTGQLQWRQTLVQPSRTVLASGVRRTAGISPARAAGVLVCPTAGGAVVALDLSRRMLLWGYQYPQKRSEFTYQRNVANFGIPGAQPAIMIEDSSDGLGDAGDRWVDSTPTITGQYVLLTPRDSNELHCLDLWDGQVRWKLPRANNLYIATTTNREVVVVGQATVMAYDLRTGKPAWSKPIPIDEPAGRGYRSGDYYHLPLVKGQLATIHLPEGRLQAISSIGRDFEGNLVAAGNRVFCQTANRIVGFADQTQSEEQIDQALRENPNDLDSRIRRGRMRLHLGDDAGAVEDFRFVLASQPTGTAVEQLADVFIRRVQNDFGNLENDADLLAKLPMSPEQTRQFFLAYIDGLMNQKRYVDAFLKGIECGQSGTLTSELESVSGTWSASAREQLAARIHFAWNQLSKNERQTVRATTSEIGKNLETVSQAQFWLTLLPSDAVSEDFDRLVREHSNHLSCRTEYAVSLERLRRSSEPQIAASATVELLTLQTKAGYLESAAKLVNELAQQFPEVQLATGQTGAEFADAWNKKHKPSELWTPTHNPWSGRQLESKLLPNGTSQREFPLLWRGEHSPIFADWSFTLSPTRSHLIARDGFGRPRWELQVHEDGLQVPIYNESFVAAKGHLLLVSFGSEFMVLETLTDDGTPRILWRRNQMEDFAEDPQGRVKGGNVQRFRMSRYAGPHRLMYEHTDDEGRPLGGITPPNDSIIVYQAGTFVRAADRYTGEIRWQYRNIARGCRIFATNSRIFLVQPDDEIWILRATDGARVLNDNPTTADSLFAVFGQHGLSWNQTREKSELLCTDLATGENLWQNEFEPGAAVSAFCSDEVAVLDRSGAFHILGIEDGKPRFQTTLPDQPRLLMMAVVRSEARYLVLTNQYRPEENASLITRPVVEGERATFVNGIFATIDRDSKSVQHSAVDIESRSSLTQPKSLPFWVVQRPVFHQFASNLNTAKNEVRVFDTRTAKQIFNDATTMLQSPMTIGSPDESGQTALRFSNATIEIKPGDPLVNKQEYEDRPENAD